MSTRHHQVADDLRRRIRSGTGGFAAGDRLPSERELSSYYRVSVPTLRDALAVLQAEGLVEKAQGRGNFVREPAPRLGYPDGPHGDLQVTTSFAQVPPGAAVAAGLGLQPGTPVTEYVRIAFRGDVPHALTRLYLPYPVRELAGAGAVDSPWGDDILGQLPRRTGVSVAHATHQVTARFPTDAEAQSLRIAIRTPVLAIERRLFAADDRVVAHALITLPGDRACVAFTTGAPGADNHDQKGAAR